MSSQHLKHPFIQKAHCLSFLEKFTVQYKGAPEDSLLSYLPVRDLIRLGKTSTLMRAAVESYSYYAWNIDKFFQYWFRTPMEFRCVLAQTGAVVTGSQAIQYFDRQPQIPGSDLDIFTRVGGTLPITTYLTQQGYTKKLRSWPLRGDAYPAITEVFAITSSPNFRAGGGETGIVAVLDFEKARWIASKGLVKVRKVQVIVVNRPPIEQIVLRFHSTGVMNYITHRGAVSLFPLATFEKRIFYVAKATPVGDYWKPAWMDKYMRRGFSFDMSTRDPHLALGKRMVNDEHTWSIEFQDNAFNHIAQSESQSIYLANESSDFDFELSWIHEISDSEMDLRFRAVMQERDVWYYVWPFYL